MHECSPEHFFDLGNFVHRDLFTQVSEVWQVLPAIKDHLAKLPLGMIEGDVADGAHLINPETIYIAPGSVVEAGAYIQGPCWIGSECTVRQGAYVRGNVITGSRCVIGHATEVKNALFLDGAQASHFAYVGDSILGADVNLGAGTKLANLKFDGGNVRVRVAGQRIDTGLRKFGAILGDRVQTGCNSVTNPGTLMGPDSGCHPCVAVHGFVGRGKIIKSTTTL